MLRKSLLLASFMLPLSSFASAPSVDFTKINQCNFQSVPNVLDSGTWNGKKLADWQLKPTIHFAVQQNNNIGGDYFHFPSGGKFVFRSSVLNQNTPCLQQLMSNYNMQSIIYLYSGDMASLDFDDPELQYFQDHGGIAYTRVLDFNDQPQGAKALKALNDRIIAGVHLVEASPGNVLVHCLGGMHRTGILYGVMQKCINKMPMDKVIADYKKHAFYQDAQNPGNYRQMNVDIIESFNCSQLDE